MISPPLLIITDSPLFLTKKLFSVDHCKLFFMTDLRNLVFN